MKVEDWHPFQIGIFWLTLGIFGLPVWLVLSLGASLLTDRYPRQDWFELIPIVLAFLVVFGVVAVGLAVTWRWLDSRPAKPKE